MSEPITLATIFTALTGAPYPVFQGEATVAPDPVAPTVPIHEARVFQRHRPLPVGGQTPVSDLSQTAAVILPASHYRVGVLRSTSELSNRSLPSSFLTALYQGPDADRSQMVCSLEQYLEYLRHSLSQNSAVDKIKNTRRVQKANAAHMQLLEEGHWNPELLQRLVELEEINLLIFDLYRHETTFYWSRGVTWPQLNLYRPLVTLVCLGDSFEPIICPCRDRRACEIQTLFRVLLRNDLMGQPPVLSFPGWLSLWHLGQEAGVPLSLTTAVMLRYRPEVVPLPLPRDG